MQNSNGPSVHDLVSRPLEVVEGLFSQVVKQQDDLANSKEWRVREVFENVLQCKDPQSSGVRQVPCLNEVDPQTIKPGTLVRMRVVIADRKSDAELFAGAFVDKGDTSSSTPGRLWRTGKYRLSPPKHWSMDAVHDYRGASRMDDDSSSGSNQNGNPYPQDVYLHQRFVYRGTSIAGESPWVRQVHHGHSQPQAQTSGQSSSDTQRRKRGRDRSSESSRDSGPSGMETRPPPASHPTLEQKKDGDDGSADVFGNPVPTTKRGMHQAAGAGLSVAPSAQVGGAGAASQQRAVLYVYDDLLPGSAKEGNRPSTAAAPFLGLKVGACVEVFGVYAIDEQAASHAFTLRSEEKKLEAYVCDGTQLSQWRRSQLAIKVESLREHCLPSNSVSPRIHVVCFRNLGLGYPLVSEAVLGEAQTPPNPNKPSPLRTQTGLPCVHRPLTAWSQGGPSFMRDLRTALVRYLAQQVVAFSCPTAGSQSAFRVHSGVPDPLAGELLLLHLLSRVHIRPDEGAVGVGKVWGTPVVGSLLLNVSLPLQYPTAYSLDGECNGKAKAQADKKKTESSQTTQTVSMDQSPVGSNGDQGAASDGSTSRSSSSVSTGPGSQRPASVRFAVHLHKLMQTVLPRARLLNLDSHTLSTEQFAPKKDYDTDEITGGLLQSAPFTHLVVDETSLSPGELAQDARRNLAVLNEVIRCQKLPYDFMYMIKFAVDMPACVVSRGRSLFQCDQMLVLPLLNEPTGSEQVQQESKEYTPSEEEMTLFRTYLLSVRQLSWGLSKQVEKRVQDDLHQATSGLSTNPAKRQQLMHLLMDVARLLCLSYGESELSVTRWQEACALWDRLQTRGSQQRAEREAFIQKQRAAKK